MRSCIGILGDILGPDRHILGFQLFAGRADRVLQAAGFLNRRRKEQSAMASLPQSTGWLAEHGPKELELLFRAIIYHPSAPILIADDERRYRDASFGAS